MEKQIEYQAKLDKLAKIEEQNRKRARRYLEVRRAKGKKQISAIIHKDVYEELCRRRDRSIQWGEPMTAGDIVEDALNATKDFIDSHGRIDYELLENMQKAYDYWLKEGIDANITASTDKDIIDNTSVNINDSTTGQFKAENQAVKTEEPKNPVNAEPYELEFENDPEIPVHEVEISDEDAEESLKVFEGMVKPEPKAVRPSSKYPNNQSELFQEDTPSAPDPEMPDRETDLPGYELWLFNRISELKDSGMKWVAIGDKFNEEGILTVNGKPWARGNMALFYKRIKKNAS